MMRMLLVLTNIIYLFQGTYATDSRALLDLNLSMVYEAITNKSTLQDRSGNHWQVYSTLTPKPILVKDFGHTSLTPLNLHPIVITSQTAVNFFHDCTDQLDFTHANTTYIGLKFMYPAPLHPFVSGDLFSMPCAYLVRSIPNEEASRYRKTPSIIELEKAFIFESNRLLNAQVLWHQQTIATFTQRSAYVVAITYIITATTQYLLPTWVLLVCACPTILLLRTLFFPMGLFVPTEQH